MINKKYLYKIQLGMGLLTGLVIQARGQVAADIGASYKQYASQTLQEKIYAHTDKTWYYTGELLWFKLYVVDANTRQPLSVSKLAYVDVLDDANNPVLQAKIALKDGLGNGSLYLPVTLANGNYKLRAYTNWMKNFGPDIFFEKQLSIINPLKSSQAVPANVKIDQDIQFFPEGGQLINGLPATVGFKALDATGNSIAVNGVVISQRNDTVAHFSSKLYGMGRFNFTPIAGNTYKAVMRTAGNNVLIKELPAVKNTGYSMHLVTEGSHVKVSIYSKDAGQNSEVYLLAHSGTGVSLAQLIKMGQDNTSTIIIDKSSLGEGVNHFTLFNANRQPVCERLYFKRPKLLNVQAAAQSHYRRRDKVHIDITAKSDAGTAQKSNLSLAVYRLDSLNNYNNEDIASYLWLCADIKGHIEHPGYYLAHTDKDADVALDNLLLTQGWSRFKWDDVLNNKQAAFKYLPEYNGHIISGKLTDASGAPANHIITYLGIISKRVQFYGASAEKDGQLYFNTRDFYGPNEIVLQTNWMKDSTYHVTVNNPFSDQYSAIKLQPFKLDKQTAAQLEAGSIGMQVQNLYKPENMRRFYSPVIDSSAFWANNYKTYLLDNYTRFTTIEEVLREYVTEVNIQKSQGHFNIKVLGPDQHYLANNPLVLLDGVPVFNPDKVFTIDPLKICRLDDVKTRYYWGPTTSFGILSFTSYKTDLGGFELDPRSVVLDYEGMQLQREFYSPMYDTEDRQKSRLPDFRNVLYWQPDVNTATDGKVRVSFYTSDRAGRYVGVVQGLAANGQVGSGYVMFEVN